MDANTAGVTMMNRQSQSSQALAVRQSIKAKQESTVQIPVEDKLSRATDDILICEGVFIYLKALSERLIQLGYVSSRIRSPLFKVAAHWVCRCRAGIPPFTSSRQIFALHYGLAMICLAAIYIRSPLLPRDLCRLVATRQVPYLAVLKTVFPPSFSKTAAVRRMFTPTCMPIASVVIRAAIELATDNYAWLPIRAMFLSSSSPSVSTSKPTNSSHHQILVPTDTCTQTAFPIGHLHLTLLRITRLIGLPDTFGARVLRWIQLRTIAMDWWQRTRIELNCDKITIVERETAVEIATDESITADVVNTMRLCYGRRGKKAQHESLKSEWESCMQTMEQWLRRGSVEDLDSVLWTGLSTSTLANLSGKRLERYVQLVDDVLTERGEQIPELWGTFLREFHDISQADKSSADRETANEDDDEKDPKASVLEHVQTEKGCLYDTDRCGPLQDIVPAEGVEVMVSECGHNPQSKEVKKRRSLAVALGKERTVYKQKSRLRPSYADVDVNSSSKFSLVITPKDEDVREMENLDETKEMTQERVEGGLSRAEVRNDKQQQKKALGKDWFPLWEPMGIGLAWTIMIKFFNGCNVDIMGMDTSTSPQSNLQRTRAFVDRTMQVTMKFIDRHETDFNAKSRTNLFSTNEVEPKEERL